MPRISMYQILKLKLGPQACNGTKRKKKKKVTYKQDKRQIHLMYYQSVTGIEKLFKYQDD